MSRGGRAGTYLLAADQVDAYINVHFSVISEDIRLPAYTYVKLIPDNNGQAPGIIAHVLVALDSSPPF